MDKKEKIVEYLKHYWYIPVIAILLALLLIGGNIKSNNEKYFKQEVDSLHKENNKLKNTLIEIRDSIEILHNLALQEKLKDTIYINKIEYLKQKTNEEISHFNTLSADSQYIIFSSLITEYSKTGFSKDTL